METVKHTKIKEILVRNADGQSSNDTTVLELERLIAEYAASARHAGFKDGYSTAESMANPSW